ncbi:hypothetical protein [Paenibacillus chitinolyticus]
MSNILEKTVECLHGHSTVFGAPVRQHGSLGHSSLGHSSLGHSSLGHSSLGHSSLGHSSLGHSSLGHSSLGHSSLGHSSLGHKKKPFRPVLPAERLFSPWRAEYFGPDNPLHRLTRVQIDTGSGALAAGSLFAYGARFTLARRLRRRCGAAAGIAGGKAAAAPAPGRCRLGRGPIVRRILGGPITAPVGLPAASGRRPGRCSRTARKALAAEIRHPVRIAGLFALARQHGNQKNPDHYNEKEIVRNQFDQTFHHHAPFPGAVSTSDARVNFSEATNKGMPIPSETG